MILYGVPAYDYGFQWNAGLQSSDARPWLWPPVQWERMNQGTRQGVSVKLAVWLVLIAYVAGWAALYLMWRRRKARLLKAASVAPSP
jgi:hypothetical protein